ncbi:alanine/glycine:cation symporter family protein [Clostridium formicaceticum]|uniref:Amino-acid carrier protein AlsT n=1 Tax=Clostridium formicaceticum TaxID=1497 RepID=A0AAC9RKQ1_9CLOT|nr:sodium:alanine symporter family protein [Clostridium formicaceticum]AOY76882.1 sodium:alanine symporter family protein [Clostridium formicaceticum]ARE87362.1 Amino-acid carrier protein AlsT [Clostridium formicaceticum]
MFAFVNTIESINSTLNGLVWGPYMLVLLVGTGIYFTFKTNFLQVKEFSFTMKETLMKIFEKPDTDITEGDITPFQALATALAATIGTGNIAGVATAIALGGPGAIFWMWVSAFFGMMTKFAEVVLAIQYREKNEEGNWVGGPMYYIEKGLGLKWLAIVFSIFGALAAFGIGNMVQSNSVAAAMTTFNIPPAVTGAVLAVAAALVILGGLKRIASVTERIVPFMAVFYIIGALIILIMHISEIPAAFGLIFKHAFTPASAVGGFAGAVVMEAMRRGVARGVFSNEAGLGSAPIAHAAARTDHPVRQGLWGIFEVFADTIVICTLTALTILATGVWNSGLTGAELTTAAFNDGLPGPGGIIVAIGILFFAFSTILSWAYYGEKCAEHLFGSGINKIYRVIWLPLIFVGAIGSLDLIWDIADTLNGLMAIPNLVGLLGLSGIVIKLTKEFFTEKINK